jgi:hypothetical protein
MRLRGEAATREADQLNEFHEAEIALARANVVKCDTAATALHKAVTPVIATQRAELEATDAANRRIAATSPESEEPTDSNDSDAESSSEENCWESAAGGLSAAAAAEERSSASLESSDFSEAEQGSTDPSDDYSEEEWEDFRKRMGWKRT